MIRVPAFLAISFICIFCAYLPPANAYQVASNCRMVKSPLVGMLVKQCDNNGQTQVPDVNPAVPVSAYNFVIGSKRPFGDPRMPLRDDKGVVLASGYGYQIESDINSWCRSEIHGRIFSSSESDLKSPKLQSLFNDSQVSIMTACPDAEVMRLTAFVGNRQFGEFTVQLDQSVNPKRNENNDITITMIDGVPVYRSPRFDLSGLDNDRLYAKGLGNLEFARMNEARIYLSNAAVRDDVKSLLLLSYTYNGSNVPSKFIDRKVASGLCAKAYNIAMRRPDHTSINSELADVAYTCPPADLAPLVKTPKQRALLSSLRAQRSVRENAAKQRMVNTWSGIARAFAPSLGSSSPSESEEIDRHLQCKERGSTAC